METELIGADLVRADLRGANLDKVDLSQTAVILFAIGLSEEEFWIGNRWAIHFLYEVSQSSPQVSKWKWVERKWSERRKTLPEKKQKTE